MALRVTVVIQNWSQLVSSISDLTAAADAIKSDVQAVTQAITDLSNVVAQLRAGSGLSQADQAALDAAVSELQDAGSALTSEAASGESVANPPATPASASDPSVGGTNTTTGS